MYIPGESWDNSWGKEGVCDGEGQKVEPGMSGLCSAYSGRGGHDLLFWRSQRNRGHDRGDFDHAKLSGKDNGKWLPAMIFCI